MNLDRDITDKRSRKNLFLSSKEWRECKKEIMNYVNEGYGLEVLPLMEDKESLILVEYYMILAREMLNRGHNVKFLIRKDNKLLEEFIKKLDYRNIDEC